MSNDFDSFSITRVDGSRGFLGAKVPKFLPIKKGTETGITSRLHINVPL